MLQLGMAAGTDKNAAKDDGLTLMYIAAQNGHHRVVETLLTAGADVNSACNKGVTPLWIAAQGGSPYRSKTPFGCGSE